MIAKLMILCILACITCTASSQVVPLPAVGDLYVDLASDQTYDSDALECRLSTENDSISVALVKFDLSTLSLSQDQVAILALKTVPDGERAAGPAWVGLIPLRANWTEESNSSEMSQVLIPAKEAIMKGEMVENELLRQDGGESIFTFDVTASLQKAAGSSMTFLLFPASQSSYLISFQSRETGEGPVLMLITFPGEIDDEPHEYISEAENQINMSEIRPMAGSTAVAIGEVKIQN